MRRERERGHADAVIKGFRRIETRLGEGREGAFRHHGVARTDAETRDGFSRTRADIDEHLIGRSGLGATLVGRERGDDADEFFLRRARPDAEALGGEDAVRPAADRSQTKEAIMRDRLNEKTDLVHVGREDHAWTLLLFRGRSEHATEAIGLQRAAAEFADEDRADRVFVARRAVGLRVGLQQTEGFGRTLRHWKKFSAAGGSAGAASSRPWRPHRVRRPRRP